MPEDRATVVRSLAMQDSEEVDLAVLRGLIKCLTPGEVCEALDTGLRQASRHRRLLVERVAADARELLLPCHEQLARDLLRRFAVLPYRKKQSCASIMDALYEWLPGELQREILSLFFTSRYRAMRKRGHKRLRQESDSRLRDSVCAGWETFRDEEAARAVIQFASTEAIEARFSELESVVDGSWLQDRLYCRMAEADPAFLDLLRDRDGIAFAYACVKTSTPIPDHLAFRLHEQYREDERLGLLVWCFGELRMWDVLVALTEGTKHRHHRLLPERFGVEDG